MVQLAGSTSGAQRNTEETPVSTANDKHHLDDKIIKSDRQCCEILKRDCHEGGRRTMNKGGPGMGEGGGRGAMGKQRRSRRGYFCNFVNSVCV